MPLASGTRLGPYEILAPLGAGGMGEVYRAHDTRLGRDVALKILPAEVANDPARRQRFELEARAVAALNHPNIVGVYDVGDGYMVSELVDGESLRGAKFGLRKVLDIATQIAGGLAAAHAAGITHRDLKPENILLTRDGRVKILDFGLAKLRSAHVAAGAETQTVHTEPGMVMGTVGYMSPEQVRGLEADHRSDIFSFGLILYELLAGQRAFSRDTSVETMTAILNHEPAELPETVPPGVQAVVAHCLEKDPVSRFQSAGDLGFALTHTGSPSGTTPVVARPPRWPKRTLMALLALGLIGLSVTATRILWRAPQTSQWSAVRLGGPEMALDPRISPDGHLLAFLAIDQGLSQVALIKPETGNWSILTHRRDHGLVFAASWSADGARIYYDRFTDVPQGIFSVPVLGGEEHLVLENAMHPEVLPDGSILLLRINPQSEMQWFRFWPESGRVAALPLLASGTVVNDWEQARLVPGGKTAVVFAEAAEPRGQGKSLFAIDLTTNAVRLLLPPERRHDAISEGWGIAHDGKALLAGLRAGSVRRIVSIPLSRQAREQTLFTTTEEVEFVDGGPDGSVYVNLVERPGEVVRLSLTGGVPENIASVPVTDNFLTMVLPLTDGRIVVPEGSGYMRLVAVEKGKDPVPLVNTTEETSAPISLAGPREIAFMIGPEPHETIATADVNSGRITRRIAPGKGTIGSLASSPDGRTLYFSARETIWAVSASGGQARAICPGHSAAMDPSGGSLVVMRLESSRARLFRVSLEGLSEQEIHVDRSVPLNNSPLSPRAVGENGLLAVSLDLPDSWFNPPVILDPATGRMRRLAADPLRDHAYPTWTSDGHVVALSLGLRATLWKFTPEAR